MSTFITLRPMVSPGSGLFCMGNFKSWNGRWLPHVGDGPSWKLRHLLNFFRLFPTMPAFFLGRLSLDKSSFLTLLVCIDCFAWRFSERVSNSACVTVSCHENGRSQWSRLKPSHEFHFEWLSNFSPSVEGLVLIQDVDPRI